MFEKAQDLYGKQVNHILTRHTSSCPTPSIPMSVGGVEVKELGGEVGENSVLSGPSR